MSKKDVNFTTQLKVVKDFIDFNPHATVENLQKTNEEEKDDPYYWPNFDATVTMRSCEKEVIEPLQGEVKGTVPKWLKGTLLRNGPGSFKVGSYEFKHWFDGSAFLHRFEILDGKVTYQSRFIQTEVYKKNHAAGRIVIDDFGTKKVPDPCRSIFQRVTSVFEKTEATDNSMISIYPFGDEFYTFTEYPFMHRVDPKTLDTLERVNVARHFNVVNHTSHPHVMSDGTVYNIGTGFSLKGTVYNIIRFSPVTQSENAEKSGNKVSIFDNAEIVATVPSRWRLHPSYMHTFGITENYFIIIEQPVSMSLSLLVGVKYRDAAINDCLKWYENENTLIQVVSRKTSKVEKTFVTEAFFNFHIINQFETYDGDYIVLDVCSYKDSKTFNLLYLDTMKNIHKDPDYPSLFRGKPLRFVMPMKNPDKSISIEENLIPGDFHEQLSKKMLGEEKKESNQIADIFEKKVSAHRLSTGKIFVTPEILCDISCDLPRVNYGRFLGQEYRYFYVVSNEVDSDNPGMLIKVDTITKTKKTWCDTNSYPSEPIFIPDPNGKNEDDGVVISSVLWSQKETEVSLLILDAATFTEIARVDFKTPSPVPKCVHGWFDVAT